MGKFKNKPDPSPRVFRRQIERSAAAYTDSKIDELKLLLENTDDELVLIDDEYDNQEDGSGDSSDGGGGLGVIFPPDEPTPWVIPRPPIRDITSVGEITGLLFENSQGAFEYNESSSYGYIYLSPDGSLTANVSVKIEGDGDIEDFEVQVTKID